jgi:hypothetical protein
MAMYVPNTENEIKIKLDKYNIQNVKTYIGN